MRRARIERLEERKMFSVTDLILDPFNSAVSAKIDEPTAIVDFIDADEISTVTGGRARTETVGKDESITIGGARTESIALGDVNNDGRADGITPTYNGDFLSFVVADFNGDGRLDVTATRNQDIEVENDETHVVGYQTGGSAGDELPVETFSLNFATIRELIARERMPGQEPKGWSFDVTNVAMRNIAGDFDDDGRDDLAARVGGQEGQEITQSASSFLWTGDDLTPSSVSGGGDRPTEEFSLSFADRQEQVSVDGVYGDDLIGWSNLIIVVCSKAPGESHLLPYVEQDNVYKIADGDDSDMLTPYVLKDTGASQQGTATNGIIAILIGLTADPSDPSGNTVYASFISEDGSPRFIRVDTTGMADTRNALVASQEYRSHVRASLLGSAEYFSRFTNTTFDDEAAAAVTVNWGDGASQVTHDKEFENWANASRFDRSYLSPGLADVPVSSILHEDNEFSFPRMSKAGAAIMAEWTSDRG